MINLRYRTFNQRRKGCGYQFSSTAPADAQSSMAQKVAPPTENDEEDVAQWKVGHHGHADNESFGEQRIAFASFY